jgi:hypothetical protein
MFGSVLCLLGYCWPRRLQQERGNERSSESGGRTTGCGSSAATPIDPATVATINGTVKFDGAAPKASKIDMSQDPGCKGMNEAENVVVDGGDVANVFVYVKDGLGIAPSMFRRILLCSSSKAASTIRMFWG